MKSLDLAILVLTLMIAVNYRVHRSVLYPPFVLCSMWLLDLALYRSGLIEVNAIHGNTLVIVLSGLGFFSFGGLLASLIPSKLFDVHFLPVKYRLRSDFWRKMLTLVVLISLPFFLIRVLREAAGGVGTTLLMRARSAEIANVEGGDVHWSLLGYIQLFTVYLPLLFAVDKRDWRFWAATFVALSVAILSTGRTDLLLLIGGLSAVYLLREQKESFRKAVKFLRGPIAVFMVLYVGLIFTNKNTSDIGGGVVSIATYLVLSYIVGPLAAFDGVVQAPGDYTFTSSRIFEFPLKVASSLHLAHYSAPEMANSFVAVPFPTNVYTIFKFYYLELGVVGTMAAFSIFGLLHSMLYMKARRGSRFATYLFGYAMYSILLSIFDDGYYLIGALLRAAVFGLLYFALERIDFKMVPRSAMRKGQYELPPAREDHLGAT